MENWSWKMGLDEMCSYKHTHNSAVHMMDEWNTKKPTDEGRTNGKGVESIIFLNMSRKFKKGLKNNPELPAKSSTMQSVIHDTYHLWGNDKGTQRLKMVDKSELIMRADDGYKIHERRWQVLQEELDAVNFEDNVSKQLNKFPLFNKTLRRRYYPIK